MTKKLLISIFIFVLLVQASTHAETQNRVSIHWNGSFEKQLSAYNLFSDPVKQQTNAGLVPYDINTPLFTDYAEKHRFMYLPEGEAAVYDDYEAFLFPVGSALIKTFSYPHDFRHPEQGRRLIETRLMIHTPKGWTGAAYVWNDAQTDAVLKIAGAVVPVEWIDADGSRRGTDYLVPNMNECKACHRGTGVTGPIGLKARQLNRTFPYPTGLANQLDHLTELGHLEGSPASQNAPRLTPWDETDSRSLEKRVQGYLDINCAHCHNPTGLASYTRLDLSYRQIDPHRRGVMKRPTAAGNSSRGFRFAIVPGRPDASFLLSRMNATEPQHRMPQVGRTLVHDEGVALMREWIESLPPE